MASKFFWALVATSSLLACNEGPAIQASLETDAIRESPTAAGLLVAIEDGGAVELDPTTGAIRHTYQTGPNAFGAVFTPDGSRAFVTDKTAGTLSEIDLASNAVLNTINVGTNPQQPAIGADLRMYIPLSGGAGIAVVDVTSTPVLLRTIGTGAGSKPHIVSLSPDGALLWATIQGNDPRVVSIPITASGEGTPRDSRYDIVPRVVFANDRGAYFTGHHSTGLHFAKASDGATSTPYLDVNGEFSEPKKQIEGITSNRDGSRAAITHEGRRAVVVLRFDAAGAATAITDVDGLSASPYWVNFDTSESTFFVSIPGSGTVEAYSVDSGELLWSTVVGGKPKRMAVRTSAAATVVAKTIHFGTNEVQQGKLNASDTLRAGDEVMLKVYVEAIGSSICSNYCMALWPRLWIRFNGSDAFQEVSGVPQGIYVMRGPQAAWSESVLDLPLTIPGNADRVEAYMFYGRTSWNGGTCYLGYDMMECPDLIGIDGTWISNYGRNFRVSVSQ